MFGGDKQEVKLLHELLEEVKALRQHFAPPAHSATLSIIPNQRGRVLRSNSPKEHPVPATLSVGQTATAVFTEWTGPNGTGNKVPPVGVVLFESDNTAVATVDQTGLVTAVGPGSANISGLDQGNNLQASDSVSVAAVAAVSATLVVTANPTPAAPAAKTTTSK